MTQLDNAMRLAAHVTQTFIELFCSDCGIIHPQVSTSLADAQVIGTAMITHVAPGREIEVCLNFTCENSIYGFRPMTVRVVAGSNAPPDYAPGSRLFMVGGDGDKLRAATMICAQAVRQIAAELSRLPDGEEVDQLYQQALDEAGLELMEVAGTA